MQLRFAASIGGFDWRDSEHEQDGDHEEDDELKNDDKLEMEDEIEHSAMLAAGRNDFGIRDMDTAVRARCADWDDVRLGDGEGLDLLDGLVAEEHVLQGQRGACA